MIEMEDKMVPTESRRRATGVAPFFVFCFPGDVEPSFEGRSDRTRSFAAVSFNGWKNRKLGERS